jgi:hypothetical protein
MRKYMAAWFAMLSIAIANGLARQYGYGAHMTELRAHQISSISAILLFGVYMWFLLRRWRPASDRQALTIGMVWLLMTIAFEFLFGHYVAGHAWRHLLQDYNLLAGRLWSAVLLWTALGPYLIYRLQRRTGVS